ncbi:MAG: PH domain-containing protein [bacterium]|nr:PH domain-containing protein [bacterium]
MVTHQEVQRQLKAVGVTINWWGRAEVRELEHVLVPEERIQYAINGRYAGGFAMLCITDQRILLIDKKPFYLTLEDVRYDMVSEVDFNQRLIDSTIVICTVNKTLKFTVFKVGKIRLATSYIQNRVMEFRHQYSTESSSSFQPQALNTQVSVPAPQYAFTPKPNLMASEQFQQQAPAAQPQHNQQQTQPQIHGVTSSVDQKVRPIVHRITNPYTRVPLMMRRRVNRFYG